MNWLPLIATQRIRQQRCRWKSCAFSAITLSQSRPNSIPTPQDFPSHFLSQAQGIIIVERLKVDDTDSSSRVLGKIFGLALHLSPPFLRFPGHGREEGREGGRYQPARPTTYHTTTRPGHHHDSFHNEPTHPSAASAAAFAASGQIMGINCRKARNGRPPTRTETTLSLHPTLL